MDELRELLSTKKDELEKLQERESTLNTTLNNTIGDGNKFEAFLIKVYKKKIKRVKKKTNNEGERKRYVQLRGREFSNSGYPRGIFFFFFFF